MVLKVIYFTCVDIDSETNGGAICCRNHIKRLSEDNSIQLFVVLAGSKEKKAGSLLYLKNLNIDGKYIEYSDSSQSLNGFKRVTKKISSKLNILKKYAPIFMEEVVSVQSHIDQMLIHEVERINADVLVLDYLYSALFCPEAIDRVRKCVVVTLNRETEFYREFLKHTGDSYVKKIIKVFRIWLTERYIFKKVDKVIALSPPDMPKHKSTYITPYLDRKQNRWMPNNSRTVFFVGNYQHYPNLEAINYIITKLAPAVAKVLPDVRFKIIGASPGDIPFSFHTVDLLGKSNANEVEHYFLNCNLFICPVENTFGLKFKIAEALAYGTPFLASSESMLCVPHLKHMPVINLKDIEKATKEMITVLENEEGADMLAKNINSQHHAFIESQKNVWSQTLHA